MSIKVERIKNESILVITYIDPITMPNDAETPILETLNFKKAVGAPVCRILDFSNNYLKFELDYSGMEFAMRAAMGQLP